MPRADLSARWTRGRLVLTAVFLSCVGLHCGSSKTAAGSGAGTTGGGGSGGAPSSSTSSANGGGGGASSGTGAGPSNGSSSGTASTSASGSGGGSSTSSTGGSGGGTGTSTSSTSSSGSGAGSSSSSGASSTGSSSTGSSSTSSSSSGGATCAGPCAAHQVCEGGACIAQAPILSIPYGSAVNGAGVDIAIDSHDNVYVVGSVAGPADFGSGTIFGIGPRDTFLVSYTENGALRWVKRFGGSQIVAGTGIAVDSNDNVVIVGDMLGSVDFGGGALPFTTAPSMVYLASFTSSGAYRFAKNYPVNADWVDVAVDANAAIYVAGTFNGTATLGTTMLTSAGAQDVFVAGFGAMGVPAWAKRLGGNATDTARSIASTPGGTVYLVGNTLSDSPDLGNGPLNTLGGPSSFVASFSATGAYQWADLIKGVGSQNADGVALDQAGHVYMSGGHTGGTDVVPGSTYSSKDNAFLRSYDAAGAFRWSWTLPSGGSQTEAFATVSRAGNLYTAGYFDVSLDAGFGPMNALGRDIFLASYQADGTPRFAQRFGGSNSDEALAVGVDSLGRCYMTGQYTGSPNYGDGAHPSSSTGGYYLLRYVP